MSKVKKKDLRIDDLFGDAEGKSRLSDADRLEALREMKRDYPNSLFGGVEAESLIAELEVKVDCFEVKELPPDFFANEAKRWSKPKRKGGKR